MIVVKNTKELEENYDLNLLRDDEQIVAFGGLQGKPKYNEPQYMKRKTYTVRQMKQIIAQMKLIEDEIPENWDSHQRAKYIYEVLGRKISYEYDTSKYKTEQYSNLTGIISGKAICAGYSLIYKEMMDRQGITCDYIRGIVHDGPIIAKHAWNILTINGESFLVDLTGDSTVLRRGEKDLKFFGIEGHEYVPDADEKKYSCCVFSKNMINAIDTSIGRKESQSGQEQKEAIIRLAIEETYKKWKKEHGSSDMAKKEVEVAIKKYIMTGFGVSFTRQGNAREQILQNVSPEDMLQILVQNYVCENKDKNYQSANVLERAISQTAMNYGAEQATGALKEYLMTGMTRGFTRTNNARFDLQQYSNPETAMISVIDNMIQRQIELIETIEEQNKAGMPNNDGFALFNPEPREYFESSEFAEVRLPEEKSKQMISRAMGWIKERMRGKSGKVATKEQISRGDSSQR